MSWPREASGRRPLVACTLGDPAGIGPEVTLRATSVLPDQPVLLLGDPDVAAETARRLESPEPREVDDVASSHAALEAGEPGPWVLAAGAVAPGLEPGRPRPEDGRAALAAIDAGADLATTGEVAALVTAPVSKRLIAASESGFAGHTEYLARRAGVDRPLMIFIGPRPAVALLTTHLPLASALVAVRHANILVALRNLDAGWRRWLGERPRIGVAGLNPHAGEDGLLGCEEEREVRPAIAAARAEGISVEGPWAADTIFRRPNIDAVLALYHDQGTILAKRAPQASVNVTFGLPYPRTSPDHGVAYDIAGRGTADPEPMIAALRLAGQLGSRRVEC